MKPEKKSPGLGLILVVLLGVIWIVQMVETYNATGSIAIYQAGGLFCALVLVVLEIQGKR